MLYSFIGLLVLVCSVCAQTPIPNRPDGFASPYGGAADSPVVLDAFVDLLCPASQAAWPTLGQVIASYKGQVRLVTHLFPLPYHTWAFIFSQGAYIVDDNSSHNVSAVYNYFDFSFNIQTQYYNPATADLSTNEIVSQLAADVQKAGIMSAQSFQDGINNSDLNMDARVAWKYACSRAITGTPSFLINGVFINADSSWTVADWQSVINPLLAANARKSKAKILPWKVSDCPKGTTLCQYNKTASECCTDGEMCIPNVGCRC